MKSLMIKSGCFFVSILFLGFFPETIRAQNRVQAKVGIKVEETAGKSFHAKAVDTIKEDNKLRVYVIPENDCHLSVIYSDDKEVQLLKNGLIQKGTELVLPSMKEAYELEQSGEQKSITIICSNQELQAVADFFKSANAKPAHWKSLEENLVQENKKSLVVSLPKNEAIGGGARALKFRPPWSIQYLPLLSAESYLIKRYRFHVEK